VDELIDALLEPDDELRKRITDDLPWDPPSLPADGAHDSGTPWFLSEADAAAIDA